MKRKFLIRAMALALSYSCVLSPTVLAVDIVGPDGQRQAPAASPTVKTYGPTTKKETLWGIAKRIRPNNSVSIFQVIGAIHAKNPTAFEFGNIHALKPNSRLILPSLGSH